MRVSLRSVVSFALAAAGCAASARADVVYIVVESGVIQRYDVNAAGTPALLSTITDPAFSRPFGLGSRLNGDLVVGNRGTCTGCAGGGLVNMSASTCGNVGSRADQVTDHFFNPHDAVVLGDDVYMVNSYGSTVRRVRFDAAGKFVNVAEYPGLDGGDGRGIVVHPGMRELFVTECCGSNRINRFAINGDGSLTFKGAIFGNGLSNPHGMCVSETGELFVANYNGNSVSRFTFNAQGNAVANGTITGNGQNQSLAVTLAPWGELLVGSAGAGTVSRFTFGPGGAAVANGTFAVSAGVDRIVFASQTPTMLADPGVKPSCVGNSVTFSLIAAARGDIGGYAYQWQAFEPGAGAWRDLHDGPAQPPFAASVTGATTPSLALADINYTDSTSYRVIVTGACGVAISEPSSIAICRVDSNCDGFLDFSDFDDFVTAFEAGEARSDFNADGFLTFEDFDAFVTAFEAGC